MGVFDKFRTGGHGGKTDSSDSKAPKIINSDELISFSSHFFLYGEIGREFDSAYDFKVERNSEGKLILSDDCHRISCETDESFFTKVNEIIKKNNLVTLNGVSRYTNGLPCEFQPCYFNAEYATGEKLSFCEDNNPNGVWGYELLKLSRKEFGKAGITELDLPEAAKKVTRFMMSYTKGSEMHSFDEVEYPLEGVNKSFEQLATEGYKDGEFETKVEYNVWNRTTNERKPTCKATIKDDFYEGLGEILEEIDLKKFASPSGAPRQFDYRNTPSFYEFYVEFEYGNVLNGFSDTAEMCDAFAAIADKLAEYIKSYIGE